jgi:hypothetical protein
MSDFSGFGCLSLLCLAPVITFTLGLLIGRDKLPFRVRIERAGTAMQKYEVDDGETKWQ